MNGIKCTKLCKFISEHTVILDSPKEAFQSKQARLIISRNIRNIPLNFIPRMRHDKCVGMSEKATELIELT